MQLGFDSVFVDELLGILTTEVAVSEDLLDAFLDNASDLVLSQLAGLVDLAKSDDSNASQAISFIHASAYDTLHSGREATIEYLTAQEALATLVAEGWRRWCEINSLNREH